MSIYDDKDLLEKLAEDSHERWMYNAKLLIASENLSKKRVKRWVNECFMPYSELSEEMKELDRKDARKILKVLKDHFGE